MKTITQYNSPNSPATQNLPTRAVAWLTMLLLLAACLCGCGTPQSEFHDVSPGMPAATAATAADVSTTNNNPVVIHEGDAIRFEFAGDTNMNKVVKVQLDGTINMELLGDVKAAGKTTFGLQAELKQRYEPLLKVSEITVTLMNSAARVYVSGAVLKPGPVAMERPMTVMEAIMEAGGFDLKRAQLSSVKVLRIENGQQKHYKVNLKKVLNGEETSTFYLKPYDVVHVPERVFNL